MYYRFSPSNSCREWLEIGSKKTIRNSAIEMDVERDGGGAHTMEADSKEVVVSRAMCYGP